MNDTKNLTEGKPTRYPELPFALDGLDKVQARKKTYHYYAGDYAELLGVNGRH